MSYEKKLAYQLNIPVQQVANTLNLLDDGSTVPFIARYRKEMTGGLDEDKIRQILAGATQLRNLDERRQTVIASIKEQGLLTPELQKKILDIDSLTDLEDLYQPYKPKRRTRASIAREKGLQGLADLILNQGNSKSPQDLAKEFLTEDVSDIGAALAGARDIIAEAISDHPDVRGNVRQKALKYALVKCEKAKDAQDEKNIYEVYYDFEFRLDRIKPYQVLAINRGEAEKVLKVKIDVAERDWRQAVDLVFRVNPRSSLAEQLRLAIDDAAKRLLLPAIERDVRAILNEQAEVHAIQVFGDNLRGLLNQPPLVGYIVMGLDPGFRTGCKVAVVDPTGKVLDTATIFPHEPQRQWAQALRILEAIVIKHRVNLIAVGNGTASRETEALAAELIQKRTDIHYVIVNEAGASVYSASPLAKAELPGLDVTLRGAVSIARRAQDPLAELVKIDPKSIGVGMYQHDVNEPKLNAAIDSVVESVVNRVGVDLNTASPALLTHVAGIGPKLAEKIVAHRDEHGVFSDRKALKKVVSLGPKAFEQAAGFLRIRNGINPLDASAIHPESYPAAEMLLKKAGITSSMTLAESSACLISLRAAQPIEMLAAELEIGVPTLEDIIEQLLRPGRDPREDLPSPMLRSDVLSIDDLKQGMQLSGTVRNVVDFGAFIDIGVKQDGLLHRSQIPKGQSLTVGTVLTVEVLSIEKERGRIGLGWPGNG